MCVSVLLILTVVYRVVRLLTVEVKVILLVLVSSRMGLSCIKDYRIASIRRKGVLGILGVTGQLILLVLGYTVIVLGPRSAVTKLVDILILLQVII